MSNSRIITIPEFHAKLLNNYRDIYVYLPPSYDLNPNKSYPVLYMHDGQNIFHPAKGTNESWNIHKTCDRLIREGKIEEIIIVGIPNMGEERGSEYAHFASTALASFIYEFKGLLYEDFIIKDLKPYIDSSFRTLKDSNNTALMGSSMGGLVTYHIGFRKPEIFGKLGIISPYMVHTDMDTFQLTPHYEKYKTKKPLKIWMDIGGYEGLISVDHVKDIADELVEAGYTPGVDLIYYCDLKAAHTEKDWANRMHVPLLYFFGSIGTPVSVSLEGRSIAGLTGKKVHINPVVKYDSGFAMSVINGKYTVENPEILTVEANGTIHPKAIGCTKVVFEFDSLKTANAYTVIDHVSESVNVSISVNVPAATDSETIDIYGLQLKKQKQGLYSDTFTVPRDMAIRFSIARESGFGSETFEVDKNGSRFTRDLKITDDISINYVVESWADSII